MQADNFAEIDFGQEELAAVRSLTNLVLLANTDRMRMRRQEDVTGMHHLSQNSQDF